MPIQTTAIGAYPKPDFMDVPDWFHNPDTANPTAGWAESVAAMGSQAEEIFTRGTQAVIDDQMECGIDIPTDGEVRRENYIHYHCRHIKGFDFTNLTEKAVRGGNYMARLPTVRSKVVVGEHFLHRDWRVAQSFTQRPVKITMPGPMTIADTTVDAHYNDRAALQRALADVLNAEVLNLAAAGCRHIQIDEPVFARNPLDALDFGIENLERCFHGCPSQVTRTVHLCCGYPDRLDNPNYPKAPQSSYQQLAAALDHSDVDAVSIEDAHRHNDLSLLECFSNTTVILGVVAVAKSAVEPADSIRERLLSALAHIDANRLIAAPDCGLGLLGRKLAMAKLSAMSTAARSINAV